MSSRIVLIIVTICISNAAISQTTKSLLTEKEKIEALISSVEKLENATFYRNGSSHNAKDAADHLRMKVNRAGSRIKTAEAFIDKIASKSSMTGQDYKIVFSDGKEVKSSTYFYSILKTLE